MKKKTGFEKFMSKEKSGAAKKEFFRQEKKKITRERKEYFEEKRRQKFEKPEAPVSSRGAVKQKPGEFPARGEG